MMENKSVLAQIHELQDLVHEIQSEGIIVDEQMQVAAIIDKLPSSWKDVQKRLSHKQSEISLVNLMSRLRIEEEARRQDKTEETNGNGESNKTKGGNNLRVGLLYLGGDALQPSTPDFKDRGGANHLEHFYAPQPYRTS